MILQSLHDITVMITVITAEQNCIFKKIALLQQQHLFTIPSFYAIKNFPAPFLFDEKKPTNYVHLLLRRLRTFLQHKTLNL